MTLPAPWQHWRAGLAAGVRAGLGLGRAMPGGDARRRDLGLRGERAAAVFLKRRGYRIVQRNVRVAIGEADLVCLAPDRATVVIVEVKTRVLPADGSAPVYTPEDSVTVEKRRKLLAVGRWLAKANRWEDRPVRIDAVAVEFAPGKAEPITGRSSNLAGRLRPAPVVRHHAGIAFVGS